MLPQDKYLILLESGTSFKYGSWGVNGVNLVSHFEPERSEWKFEHFSDGQEMSIQNFFTQNYLAPNGDGQIIASAPHPYAWDVQSVGGGHYLIQSNHHYPPVLSWTHHPDKPYVILTSHPVGGAGAVTWVIKPDHEHAVQGNE